ncbi:MAG: GCN5-related N-acetyltransferase [Verrucomicrobiales bacterium]|nr:GCN5-related N-acetyltransferase [Verrucomicrobiales bacterium]
MILEIPALTGRFITLTPLEPDADSAALFRISHAPGVAEALWRYMPAGPFPDAAAMRNYLHQWQSQADVMAFTVRASIGGEGTETVPVGSISVMNYRREHRTAELGYIWYAPAVRRTKVNTEANYLLLRHCFEVLGCRRMEWKCDSLNLPSRAAALRLGYRFEGLFRQHLIVKGLNRDTTWFSMLDSEWPQTGQAIAQWLYQDNSVPLSTLTKLAGS